MNLQHLSDDRLEKSLVELVSRERALLCSIIQHVMEISRRGNYLKAYPNLFTYLSEFLKYSHGSAQRRIDAAMLALEVPALLADVENGDLNLSQITTAQVAFRAAVKQFKKEVASSLKLLVISEIRGKTVAESEVIIYSLLKIKPKTRTKVVRQGDGSVRLETTFSNSQWTKLERVRELLSHSVPTGDFNELTEYLWDRVIAHKDKTTLRKNSAPPKSSAQKNNFESSEKFVIRRAKTEIPDGNGDLEITGGKADGRDYKIGGGGPNSETQAADVEMDKARDGEVRLKSVNKRSHIRVSVQREIFSQDRCCQYQDPVSGKICGSGWQSQLDHIQPLWPGGTNAPGNLRVLCSAHNQRRNLHQAGGHRAEQRSR